MLQSDLCDYSNAYIVVKGTVTNESPDNDVYDKKSTFKNNASFISCISKTKTNKTLIDIAEDLDTVMAMDILTEYRKNYRKTTGSLWNYYRDEPNSITEGNINCSIKDSKSFDYKRSITGKLEGNNLEKEDVEIAVPLKHLSNFWRTLDIPLINCEVSLILTWSENCVLTNKVYRRAVADVNAAVAGVNNPTDATFKITDTK